MARGSRNPSIAVLCSLPLFAPAAALAQAPVPTVVVTPPELAAEAEAAATERPWLRVVAAEPEPQSADPRGDIASAWQQYVAMDFEPSFQTISAVVVQLEASASTRAEFDALTQALIIRGMGELALGREDAARQSFRAAARLRPDGELSEARYPPPVREAYGRERDAVRAEPRSSLTVTATPEGADVFLDGDHVGPAPQTISATGGRHQLRVEALGYAPRTLTATFGPTDEPLEVALPRAGDPEAARQVMALEADPGEAARVAFARSLRARRLLRLRAGAEGVELLVVDLDSGVMQQRVAESVTAAIESVPAGEDVGDAPDDPAAAPDGARRNDGLFARFALGLNIRGDSFERPDINLRANGGSLAADLEIAIGGHLGGGWILGGTLLSLLGGTNMKLDAPAMGERHLGIVSGLALFTTWYPGAEGGFNLYAAIGGARGVVSAPDDDSIPSKALVGISLALGVGWDFWITDELAAGALIRLIGFGMQKDETKASAGGVSLVGTLTYN